MSSTQPTDDRRPTGLDSDQLETLGKETDCAPVQDAYPATSTPKSRHPGWTFVALLGLAVAAVFVLRALLNKEETVTSPVLTDETFIASVECDLVQIDDAVALVQVKSSTAKPLCLTALVREWSESGQVYQWALSTIRRIPLQADEETTLYVPVPEGDQPPLVIFLASPLEDGVQSDPELEALLDRVRVFDPNSNDDLGLQTHALRVRKAIPPRFGVFPMRLPSR